jgi:hypothetical protein
VKHLAFAPLLVVACVTPVDSIDLVRKADSIWVGHTSGVEFETVASAQRVLEALPEFAS